MAIDKVWLDAATEIFGKRPQNPLIQSLVSTARGAFDTLRRSHGGGNLTDDSRLSMLAAAQVLNVIAQSNWVKTLDDDPAATIGFCSAVVASLISTGK